MWKAKLPPLPIKGGKVWQDSAGNPITCKEKLSVLEENAQALTHMFEEALEEALIMGCSNASFRNELRKRLEKVQARVKER